MSLQSQQMRQNHSRRKCLLSPEGEDCVIQLTKERRSQHQEVSIDWARQAIKDITNGRVTEASKAYISRFWKKVGCPSQRTQELNKKEGHESLEEEMNQFRNEVTQYVRDHDVPPSRIFTMDEIGL